MCLGKYILRGAHHIQKRRNDGRAQHRKRHAQNQREGYRRVHRLAKRRVIMRAVALRDHNRAAGGQTHCKAHQRVDDRPRAANRSQRRLANELSYNNGIHRVVQLLKDHANHHRNCKLNQMPPDRPFGHISGAASAQAHGQNLPVWMNVSVCVP